MGRKAWHLNLEGPATGKKFNFINARSKQESFFSRESYRRLFTFFPVFAYIDINTQGVGRILDSCANPWNPPLRLGFADQTQILPASLMFALGGSQEKRKSFPLTLFLFSSDFYCYSFGESAELQATTILLYYSVEDSCKYEFPVGLN